MPTLMGPGGVNQINNNNNNNNDNNNNNNTVIMYFYTVEKLIIRTDK